MAGAGAARTSIRPIVTRTMGRSLAADSLGKVREAAREADGGRRGISHVAEWCGFRTAYDAIEWERLDGAEARPPTGLAAAAAGRGLFGVRSFNGQAVLRRCSSFFDQPLYGSLSRALVHKTGPSAQPSFLVSKLRRGGGGASTSVVIS